MSFAGLQTSKVDSPFRTGAGEEWSDFPNVGNDYTVKRALPPCSSCSKSATHGPPCDLIGALTIFGETRNQRVPAENRLTIQEVKRVWHALWIAGYVAQGYPGDLAFLSGYNSAAQIKTYEIASVSGSQLTIKGPNPKRLVYQNITLNENYFTGVDDNRINVTDVITSMQIGAMVTFLPPSVLAGKVAPVIKSIDFPTGDNDTETFTVTLWESVTSAMQPKDLAFPAEKYYCHVTMYGLAPVGWPNWQAFDETQFSPRSVVDIQSSALMANGGVLDLTASDDSATRVLYPSMMQGALSVVRISSTGAVTPLTADQIETNLTTRQTGDGTWSTTLNLGEWLEDSATFNVEFWAERVSGDAYGRVFSGECGNCQYDSTGSYDNRGGDFCAAKDATQRATFQAMCWQPDCSHFCLIGGKADRYEGSRLKRDVADYRDAAWYTRAFHSVLWQLTQFLEGAAQFQLQRGELLGLGGFLGAFFDEPPGGVYTKRELLYPPNVGQKVTTSDVDGNADQDIVTGLFIANDEWDASGAPPQGFAPASISGWRTKLDPSGGAPLAGVDYFPEAWVGGRQIYQITTSGRAMSIANSVHSMTTYATGISVSGEQDAEIAAIVDGVI